MSLCFWPSFCCGSSFISRNGRRSSTWPFSESWVPRRGGQICSPCPSAGCWALCKAGMLQEWGEEKSLDKWKKCCVQASLMLQRALHAGVEEINEWFRLEKCSVFIFLMNAECLSGQENHLFRNTGPNLCIVWLHCSPVELQQGRILPAAYIDSMLYGQYCLLFLK